MHREELRRTQAIGAWAYLWRFIDGTDVLAAAPFESLMAARMVDENLPHETSGDTEEVKTALPVDGSLTQEDRIRLVDQHGRAVQRWRAAFIPKIASRDPTQVSVHERHELVERGVVTVRSSASGAQSDHPEVWLSVELALHTAPHRLGATIIVVNTPSRKTRPHPALKKACWVSSSRRLVVARAPGTFMASAAVGASFRITRIRPRVAACPGAFVEKPPQDHGEVDHIEKPTESFPVPLREALPRTRHGLDEDPLQRAI